RVAAYPLRRLDSNLAVIDHEHGELAGTADDDDRIAATALGGKGKAAARERVVDALGQRAPADDGEFGGCRERSTDQRAECKHEGGLWRKRIDRRATFIEEQSRAETAASDVPPQDRLCERHPLGRAARHIDTEIAAVIPE